MTSPAHEEGVGVTADTSVVIPALASWHEFHDIARKAVRDVHRLPAHVVLESLSVLTRLPGGRAITPSQAVALIAAKFSGRIIVLPHDGHADLVARIGTASVRGGQVYDALVAATAKYADATLLTLDSRAGSVYRAVDVEFSLLV